MISFYRYHTLCGNIVSARRRSAKFSPLKAFCCTMFVEWLLTGSHTFKIIFTRYNRYSRHSWPCSLAGIAKWLYSGNSRCLKMTFTSNLMTNFAVLVSRIIKDNDVLYLSVIYLLNHTQNVISGHDTHIKLHWKPSLGQPALAGKRNSESGCTSGWVLCRKHIASIRQMAGISRWPYFRRSE